MLKYLNGIIELMKDKIMTYSKNTNPATIKIQVKTKNKFDAYLPSLLLVLSLLFLTPEAKARLNNDTIRNNQDWNIHFQNTVISQYHPSFHAKYTGKNSLLPSEESTTSISATLFLGVKLWKGASAYYNIEISGGSGFSATHGVAGFPNGEVYRVDNPSPKIYSARFYVNQIFPLSGEYEKVQDGINQLAGKRPVSYLSLTFGKFSVLDFFDKNEYSHDPRSQFYNWALMGNGAWDYPANTRGYTYGFVAELVKQDWALRLNTVMVPVVANGPDMDKNIIHSNAEALEFEHKYNTGTQHGTIRLITFLNNARMGNYKEALEWGINHQTSPAIDTVKHLGTTKFGLGINLEHQVSKKVGLFLRASWNDGRNETWAFTEIDRAVSAGLHLMGSLWTRENDSFCLALLANGLSKDHKDYLRAGGYGFIIGDGQLNYQPEVIAECYYAYRPGNFPLWLSPDYQFIINPAYNRDRGPVHAFGLRAHYEF